MEDHRGRRVALAHRRWPATTITWGRTPGFARAWPRRPGDAVTER